jgi:DNA-binding transcriptional LysR family regulator
MRLTSVGREYLAALEPAYREMRRAALEVGANRGNRKVTISLSHSLAVGWLIPRLGRFRSRHPDIEVAIQTTRTAESIRNGDADFGLCATDIDVAGLHVELLIDLWVTPVACPRIATAIRQGLSSFEDYPLLGVSQNPDLWSWWCNEAGMRGKPLQESLCFDIAHALYESAAGGFGIAIGLLPLLGPHLQSGRLVDLGLPTLRYPGGYQLVGRSKRIRNTAIAALWNWLIEEGAAKDAPLQHESPTDYATLAEPVSEV